MDVIAATAVLAQQGAGKVQETVGVALAQGPKNGILRLIADQPLELGAGGHGPPAVDQGEIAATLAAGIALTRQAHTAPGAEAINETYHGAPETPLQNGFALYPMDPSVCGALR